MRIIVGLLLVAKLVFANILFLGTKNQAFKCDGELGHTVSLQSCSNVEALDTLTICYLQNTNLGCKKLFQHEIIKLDSMDKDYSLLEKIFAFDPNTKVSMGIKRFSEENNDNVIAMPYGTILKPKKSLKISMLENKPTTVLLIKDGKKIFEKTYKADESIVLDPKYFEYDKNYILNISTAKTTYKGEFDTLDKESTQEIEKSLSTLSKSTEEKESKKLIAAILYEQYGLIYDKFKILGETNAQNK
jgi:hypothetical protein